LRKSVGAQKLVEAGIAEEFAMVLRGGVHDFRGKSRGLISQDAGAPPARSAVCAVYPLRTR
jgi:hypothetical protein